MRTSRIFTLSIIASLAGCQQFEWYSPINKNVNHFNADHYSCLQQSAQSFPVVMQSVSFGTGTQTQETTQCVNNRNITNCTTTPAQYTPPQSVLIDVNLNSRNQAYNACMYANGWAMREKK